MEGFSKEELQCIGARVRELRIKRGLTQAELSERAHISLQRISPIEMGKSEMKVSTLAKIAEVLDVSVDLIIRPNTSGTNAVYQNEFRELLGDCTPEEADAILGIVKQLKSTMRVNKGKFDM